MRKIIAIIGLSLLTGCAGIVSKIPSFWDDNQSAKIIDARLSVERIDCASDSVKLQVAQVRDQLLWFELYSESKGLRQRDVIQLIQPARETVEDMHKRLSAGAVSKGYCDIKVRVLRSQTQRASEAILGRF